MRSKDAGERAINWKNIIDLGVVPLTSAVLVALLERVLAEQDLVSLAWGVYAILAPLCLMGLYHVLSREVPYLTETTEIEGIPSSRRAYSPGVRKALWVVLIAVLSVPPVVKGARWYLDSLPPEGVKVLVAQFDGPREHRVTSTLIDSLRVATQGYDDVGIEGTSTIVTEMEGSRVAQELGEEKKASLVLWGWYGAPADVVRMVVHVEPLSVPEGLELLSTRTGYQTKVAELTGFRLQARLSGEMSHITLLVTGLAHFEQGDFEGAVERFGDALAREIPRGLVDPALVSFSRGTAYLYLGRFDSAVADFDRAIEASPNQARAYVNRGVAHLYRENFDWAIEDQSQGLRLTPESDSSLKHIGYFNRAGAYFLKGRLRRAISDLSRAIAFEPESSPAYANRGVVYTARGQLDEAMSDFEKALRLDPENTYAYGGQANVFLQKGKLNQAVANYTQIIRLTPQDARAYSDRGGVYNQLGKYDQALDDLNRALDLDSRNSLAYTNRGDAYRGWGEIDRAIADYTSAIALDSSFAKAHKGRGESYLEKGRLAHKAGVYREMSESYDQAIADLNRAIELDRSYTAAYYSRGTVYYNRGASSYNKTANRKAIADYSRVIALRPDHVGAYLRRGVVYYRENKLENAERDLRITLRLTDDPVIQADAKDYIQRVERKRVRRTSTR